MEIKKILIASYKKFLSDAISKVYYDIAKGVLYIFISFILLKILPTDSNINKILDKKISLSIYTCILVTIFIIVVIHTLFKISFNRKYQSLKILSQTDEPTGLRNNKALQEHLTKKIAEVTKTRNSLSIILIDIDDFADFNENYSQTIGDKIIEKVGQLLSKDTRITDETFRQYSRGDEFIVVSSGTNITEAGIAAKRKKDFLENTTFIIDDNECKLTVCCGLSEYKEGDTYSDMIDRANYAVRNIAKKNLGKNSIAYVM